MRSRKRARMGALAALALMVVVMLYVLRGFGPSVLYASGLSSLAAQRRGVCQVDAGAWVVGGVPGTRNNRSVLRGTVSGSATFAVYIATGRPFVVAKRDTLERDDVRRCLSAFGREQIAGRVGVGAADLDPEPVWVERALPREMRLPRAKEFMKTDGLGKMYLDVGPREQVDGRKKTPYMSKRAYGTWGKLARGMQGGGGHLDWGTGSSSHFACGEYARVSAIDSQKQWCDEVGKTLSPAQKRCSAIEMHCLDVGKLGPWGFPTEGTSPEYFDKYVSAIDAFPHRYYDTVLVDGRFRTACAVKALKYLRVDSVLMIHDFSSKRPLYARVFEYFEELDRHDELVFLGVKTKVADVADLDFAKFKEPNR